MSAPVGATMAARMTSMKASSDYVLADYALEPLREGGDFTLYRGRQHGNPSPVLAIALSAEQPSAQSLRRLEHEYSLAADLDPAWAARPLALTRHEARTMLVLKDPGGEPLDRVLDRGGGQPLELTQSGRRTAGGPGRESAGGNDRPARRAKGQGVSGLCVGARVFFGRHGTARRKRLGQPLRIDVQPMARTRGVRVS